MEKNTTTPTAPEHTSVEAIRGNKVRLTADQGYLVRSKHTGKTSQSVITAHVGGYEVIKNDREPVAPAEE